MDSIDRFLALLDLQTDIDVFCNLKAPFYMESEPELKGTAWFHLLLEGNCTMSNAGKSYDLKGGDFCLWAHSSKHSVFSGKEESRFSENKQNGIAQLCNDSNGASLRMLCGSFRVRNRAAIGLLEILPEPLIVSLSDIPQLPALCSLIHNEALIRSEGSITVVRSLCEVLLLLALRHVSALPEKHRLTALFSEQGLARALSHILSAPFAPYTTEGLAEIACMSRATFARKFQLAAGCGVQTFIRTLKMSAAAKMLRDGNLAVSRIAEETGYQSEAAFNNAFKAQFGVTPARYRRQDLDTTPLPNPA
ncbi:MAG: AraC family transcriptional regulator [Cardiobacteriaceae bacterium]|nr:AraC family transcriptional regulator [Cardiobacteriaceae bacterium]